MSHSFDIQAINERFAQSGPEEILAWAALEFGNKVVISSSFQTQSVALLHLISCYAPQIEVVFVDTGYHFPETLAYRDQLIELLHINVVNVSADEDKRQDFDANGNPLWQTNPDLCCALHKIAPMGKALLNREAWISGIRRDQTAVRSAAQPVEQQADGLYKVNALINWTSKDLWKYINRNDLPVHPLFNQGYLSIGCAPCTRPVQAGEDERSGRWAGKNKVECGLHTTEEIRVAPNTEALAS
jgi:phosphoadenosine phosphosulfate reductase